MKLCERCHNNEVMPIPLKDEPSTPSTMEGSTSETKTFFFPFDEGRHCYFCQKKLNGAFKEGIENYTYSDKERR